VIRESEDLSETLFGNLADRGANQQAFEDKKGISPDRFIGLGIFFASGTKQEKEDEEVVKLCGSIVSIYVFCLTCTDFCAGREQFGNNGRGGSNRRQGRRKEKGDYIQRNYY